MGDLGKKGGRGDIVFVEVKEKVGGLGKKGGRGDVVFQVVVEVKEKVVGLGKEGGGWMTSSFI